MTREEIMLKLQEIKNNTRELMKDESNTGNAEEDKGQYAEIV